MYWWSGHLSASSSLFARKWLMVRSNLMRRCVMMVNCHRHLNGAEDVHELQTRINLFIILNVNCLHSAHDKDPLFARWLRIPHSLLGWSAKQLWTRNKICAGNLNASNLMDAQMVSGAPSNSQTIQDPQVHSLWRIWNWFIARHDVSLKHQTVEHLNLNLILELVSVAFLCAKRPF